MTIAAGPVSHEGLEAPADRGLYFQTAPDRFWPDVARFTVRDGRMITYQAELGSDEQTVRLFLLGSCFGALLHQRGLLVMHGAAVRHKDGCVIFAGPSGSGKSTLAATLQQRGFELFSDDLCAVNEQNRAVPGYPQLKLWRNAIDKLAVEQQSLRHIRVQIDKHAVPARENFCAEPLPVKAIYFLSSHNLDSFAFKELRGAQAFLPLRNNTYRIPSGSSKACAWRRRVGSLSQQAALTRLTRPKKGFLINELAEAVLADLAAKEARP